MGYIIYLVIVVILVLLYILYRNIKDFGETLNEIVRSSLKGEEVVLGPGFEKPMKSAILINVSIFILAILILSLNPAMSSTVLNILIFWMILAPYSFMSFFTSRYLYNFPIEEMRGLVGLFISLASNLPSLTLYLIFSYIYSWPFFEIFTYFTIVSYVLVVFLSVKLKRKVATYKN
ncbi:MAG: hypothetical protein ACTSVF_00740 [Candidatus Asgardarchaeia archaeon]